MDLATVLVYVQSLLVLVIFFVIIAGGFKVWGKKSTVPPI